MTTEIKATMVHIHTASHDHQISNSASKVVRFILHLLEMLLAMMAGMIVRGHGWRHSMEMAFAMFAPVAAINGLHLVGSDANLPWLVWASHPAMPLGMSVIHLFSFHCYTRHNTRYIIGTEASYRQTVPGIIVGKRFIGTGGHVCFPTNFLTGCG